MLGSYFLCVVDDLDTSNVNMKTIKNNLYMLFPLGIFSLLFLPFITTVPMLDGNIDFVKSHYFFIGGFPLYFANFTSIHPPLKIFLTDILYFIFGENYIVFNLLGVLFGYIAIISTYFIGKAFDHKKVGLMASLLLSIQPLFIASGIYGLNDFLLTSLILLSISLYLYRKYAFLSAALTLVALAKETGLLVIILFLCIDFFCSRKKYVVTFFPYVLPLATYTLWSWFLHTSGKGAWKDWIFTDTADRGTFYTVANNIINLKIFNVYALQHWAQLLFLNFNWILIILATFSTCLYFSKKHNRHFFARFIMNYDQKSKATIFIVLFCFLYGLTVLTLQTYTIPRYALPIIPFLLLWFSVSIFTITKNSARNIIIGIAFIFTVLGLFGSVDPVATVLWGKTRILGQDIYATNIRLSGNDGITYNLQYLLIAQRRTDLLHGAQQPFSYRDCLWLSPDPHNDQITFAFLKIQPSANTEYCKIRINN